MDETEGPTEAADCEPSFTPTEAPVVERSEDDDVEVSSSAPSPVIGFTGSGAATASTRRLTSGYPTTTTITSSSSSSIPWPSTIRTTSGSIYASSGGMVKSKPTSVLKRFVRMPGWFTPKVLVSFLDPDEKDPSKDVTWAANLPLIDAEIRMEDGITQLVLTLSLEDTYGNNPEDKED